MERGSCGVEDERFGAEPRVQQGREMAVEPAHREKSVEMEARIARVESDVAHLRVEAADIKADVRELRGRMDNRMDRLESKFDGLESKFDGLKDAVYSTKVWALMLYIALAAGTFGTMARAFGWI
ncbi:MAG TPA: hypothetical protein VFX89_18490 [Gammaproteobacteria bacterium]|nr:hypothetical protein [Gammaproteobacteria bacterium]